MGKTWEKLGRNLGETWEKPKIALNEYFMLDKVPIECYTISVGKEPPFNQKGANMKIRLKLKKGPPDGWLVIWSKEDGRKTALHVKLSFFRNNTPEEQRQIWQHRREELEKYHESKRRFPNEPQKWNGHPTEP